MEVYSFHPAVRTSFQHRVMAGLDNWFFLGGYRLKVVFLDKNNCGWACQKLVSISKTEKILKILSYLLVPIVLIALLIRCFLHARFKCTWNRDSLIDSRVPSDVRPFHDFRLFNNQERLNIWKNRIYVSGVDVLVASVDYLKSQFSGFNHIPKAIRCENYVRNGQFSEEGKKSYLRGMLTHIVGYILSVDETYWEDVILKIPAMNILSEAAYSRSVSTDPNYQHHGVYLFLDKSLQVPARHVLGEGNMLNTAKWMHIRAERPGKEGECIAKQFLKDYCKKHLEVMNCPDFIESLLDEKIREFHCPSVLNSAVCDIIDHKCQEHLLKAIINEANRRLPGMKNSSFTMCGDQVLFYTVFSPPKLPPAASSAYF
ncbi:hypothetical protein CPK_ORF00401 [Chlamydia pneumoniae LPCoLN]|nr:DUF648 domain-containing protein [Chlamydia pneumoniae]ACZ32877.1 hypothetical protein CPK_ORF00401 [Chlamydia pneumoniae LPCoLN]ETR79754.1 hypothetical protein X556_0919 [Chlamydia pneumoniae B21]